MQTAATTNVNYNNKNYKRDNALAYLPERVIASPFKYSWVSLF